ncbi:MAG: glycosyltransferase [Sphingobacteriales bacterium]|nr:glycosyltransferase [Sphingobacteriales bacterium]OJW35069.1 MAG: hypothetical protein BGO54_02650 [Sphingobacteriales bacterium 46-32]
MKIAYFCHSVISDWTNENAHFFRGIARALSQMGHEVRFYESINNWSLTKLLRHEGATAIDEFRSYYPDLQLVRYRAGQPDLSSIVQETDLVIVHDWNDPELLVRLSLLRRQFAFRLMFQDTCHRPLASAGTPAPYDLSGVAGILVFSSVLKSVYRRHWPRIPVLVWHPAADTSVFKPVKAAGYEGEMVWIGNWGSGERGQELFHWLAEPVAKLGIKATVYGTCFSDSAKRGLAQAGISYGGWVPDFSVPEIFARFLFTVYVPPHTSRNQSETGPGIQPFKAMACGIPLITTDWHDDDSLFTAGYDYLKVRSREELMGYMQRLRKDTALRQMLAGNALSTINKRHTCRHRAVQLIKWVGTLSAIEPEGIYSTV